MSLPPFEPHLSVQDPEGHIIEPLRRTKTDVYRINIDSLEEHVPKAINRFASPSCPWPWAGDSESDEARGKLATPPGSRASSPAPGMPQFSTRDWREYPGRFFPNWTPYVVERCGMQSMFAAQVDGGSAKCKIYPVDIQAGDGARFVRLEKVVHHPGHIDSHLLGAASGSVQEFLESRPDSVRLRCLCVENLSGDVLRLLGAYYRIEPFYFSSAINRIPSRYQEEFDRRTGEHTSDLYITLPFLKVTKVVSVEAFDHPDIMPSEAMQDSINVFAPLSLVGINKFQKFTLQQDMLAVMLVRAPGQETLITIHPGPIPHSARTLQDRIFMAGKGVYWGNLMRKVSDPIFVMLVVMWSALYAWDEAMEVLYTHITYLETRVIHFTVADVQLSPQLHAIRAHLTYYDDLLDEFLQSLDFIGRVGVAKNRDDTELGEELLKKELQTLESQVKRLKRQRDMQDSRLSNVMKLVMSMLNLKETQAGIHNGESMKQITYLTMIYLPASFIASIFGMNVKELSSDTSGSFSHYFAVMIPLSVLTVWIAVAVSRRIEQRDTHMLHHALWPFYLTWDILAKLFYAARVGFIHQQEKLQAPRHTLKHVAQPRSRAPSAVRRSYAGPGSIPMRSRSPSVERSGRTSAQKELFTSDREVNMLARDFADPSERVIRSGRASASKTVTASSSPM